MGSDVFGFAARSRKLRDVPVKDFRDLSAVEGELAG